jgi:pyridoxine kinase
VARILSISSQVVRGHVGNSAASLALARLGHEVWSVPTVILSNHPGHKFVAGSRMQPDVLRAMLAALADNSWLGEVDALMTGYLPSPEHVAVAREAIAKVRALTPGAFVLVDPVIGDDPDGLYIDECAATGVRDELIGLADVITPNRFELDWLSGVTVGDLCEAEAAAQRLSAKAVLGTSLPDDDPERLVNALLTGSGHAGVTVARRASVPHGTGDLLAALFLGHVLSGAAFTTALGRSVAGVEAAIAGSEGCDELQLIATQRSWAGR